MASVLVICAGFQDPFRFTKIVRSPEGGTGRRSLFEATAEALVSADAPLLARAAELGLLPGPFLNTLRSLWLAGSPSLAGLLALFAEYPAASEDLTEEEAEELILDHLRWVDLPLEEVWMLYDGTPEMAQRCRRCEQAAQQLAKDLGQPCPEMRLFSLFWAESELCFGSKTVTSRFVMEGEQPADAHAPRGLFVHLVSDCLRVIPGALRDLWAQALDDRQAVIVLGPGTPQMNLGLLDAAREAELVATEGQWNENSAAPPLLVQVLEPEDNPKALGFLQRVYPRVIETVRPTTTYDSEQALEERTAWLDAKIAELQQQKELLIKERSEGPSESLISSLEDWQEFTRAIPPSQKLETFRRQASSVQVTLIREALRQGGSNVQAANLLGLSGESTLRNLRRDLGV
jgi:hypothetical protein